jgi:hypothetical protein
MTDDADLQPAVAGEFLALAELLDPATEAQWVPTKRPWRARTTPPSAGYSDDDG